DFAAGDKINIGASRAPLAVTAGNGSTVTGGHVQAQSAGSTTTLYIDTNNGDGKSSITTTGPTVNNIITGTPGADNLAGTAQNDTISGVDDNDTITGGAGNDTIDGGLGLDTAVFSGSRSGYTVTRTAGVLTVTGADGA